MVDFSLGMERRICEFGFPGPLRDQLVDAGLSGVKTATSSLLADWQRDGEQPPAAGELQTVIDSAGTPVVIIEILGSEVVALGAVDDRVARAEGESYQTAAGWRSAHERFWREEVFRDWEGEVPVLDDSTLVVVEWFRLRERVWLLSCRPSGHELPAAVLSAEGGHADDARPLIGARGRVRSAARHDPLGRAGERLKGDGSARAESSDPGVRIRPRRRPTREHPANGRLAGRQGAGFGRSHSREPVVCNGIYLGSVDLDRSTLQQIGGTFGDAVRSWWATVVRCFRHAGAGR